MFGSLGILIKIGIPFSLFDLKPQFSNLVLRKAIFVSTVAHNGQFRHKLSRVIICRMRAHNFRMSGVPEDGCLATTAFEHELPILEGVL